MNSHTALVIMLAATTLFAGCVGQLKDLGVENWTCDVADPAASMFDDRDPAVMKTYTGGDCAALVQECRNRDICRLVKTEGKPEYLIVGLELSDPQVQKLIFDGPVEGDTNS